jgi:NAD(P)-dependent dehydrogenase (short-subunit alcohol dehydrogenase family)
VSLVEAAGQKAVAVPGDLTSASFCRELVQQAVDGMGGLDAIVNVAGVQVWQESIDQITDEQFDRTFKTNVYAPFWIIKAALPHLRPGSTIVNTASLEAYTPAPDRLDYATTKGAINNFSKGLAQQLVGKGIRVNVVAPGPTWSVLQVTQGVDPETLPEFGSSESPMGRAAQPAEQAPAYVFLTSAESSFVAGETLNVNGGMVTP